MRRCNHDFFFSFFLPSVLFWEDSFLPARLYPHTNTPVVTSLLELLSSQLPRMATPPIESESNNGATHDEQSSSSFDSNQISSDEQLTQIIDSINGEETTTTNAEETTPSPAPRTAGQTAIGAKLVKKLETLGQRKLSSPTCLTEFSRLAASTKEVKTAAVAVATATASANNDSDSRRNINKTASMNL